MASYDSVFLLNDSHIPHLLQGLERSELRVKRCPSKTDLVIAIPHKAFDCFHVILLCAGWCFYDFNLRNVCHRKVFLVHQ